MGGLSVRMSDLSLILQYGLAVVLVLLAILSAQLAVLGFFRLTRPLPRVRVPALPDEVLPDVLVQLPVRDEGALALRVAAAAARLDWPLDKLEIQLLDDGSAEHHDELVRAVLALVPAGVKFSVLRRSERTGFKAGNLAFGLTHSEAPFVAIFDADFVPPRDFLRRTVPALLADSGLCFVQARWTHANREKNWLTRAQGLLLDAHFTVEQEARFRSGLPLSFNGTAGVWRRKAIENAGGWSGDTLTEDLDLSMRCVLNGWRAAFLGDLEVPGELPETAAAWRAQQARWTKGHAQCARKLLGQVWSSRLPLHLKAAMSLQMCQFAFYTLAFLTAATNLTLMYIGADYLHSMVLLGWGVTAFGLSTSLGYLWLGQKFLGRDRMIGLHRSLLLGIIFPSGLVLSNTRATWEAFFSSRMVFQRTLRAGERYVGGWRGGPELVVGVLLPAFAFAESAWSAPFFAFAVAGLISIGALGYSGSAPQDARAVRRILPGD
jgi:cellulose synthase/poly-beta-1,6-N-acetylglucosamine synthase-like glycosyltransferase